MIKAGWDTKCPFCGRRVTVQLSTKIGEVDTERGRFQTVTVTSVNCPRCKRHLAIWTRILGVNPSSHTIFP